MTTSAAGIRQAYEVPAKRDDRVLVDGRPGRIAGFRNGRLRVRFDDDPQNLYNAHPVRGIVYVDGGEVGS